MNLKDIPTCELVKELEKRKGVEYIIVAPYEIEKFQVEGPMILLKIID